MTLEIIIFASAILFGFFWYWRESLNNGVYRFFNKLFNSEELQMKPNNRKGFVFQQNIVFRVVYILLFLVLVAGILEFLTPLRIFSSYFGFSAFASSIFGTLLGTYAANFILKTSNIIEEQSDDIEDFVKEKFEDGKEFIENLKEGKDDLKLKDIEKPNPLEAPQKSEKSARDRLKDKGYM